MNDAAKSVPARPPEFEDSAIDQLYDETAYWDVNLGEEKIHAKRIPGGFRRLKWLAASLYLFYFAGPYIRWGGRQAVLFDIPGRKYHLFGVTLWPQDIWILALVLLTFFITLFAVTALAGRVFCGYFCWQTVWVDVYTWIEEKLEGPPARRRALDKAPWTPGKMAVKTVKHSIFMLLSALTGITFVSYFMDTGELWGRYFTLQGPVYIWTVPLVFLIGSYIGVAIMREQVCLWLCPYARVQGVMVDLETMMPTYDFSRGEPRARVRKGKPREGAGDCVDCSLCVAVCPTGVDIRKGQQEGCITCGLCIDACDSVMDRLSRPRRLIRYMSLKELRGEKRRSFWRRGRALVYCAIILFAVSGTIYGLVRERGINLTVIHARQPLYTLMSDGSIQNGYTLKIINRTGRDETIGISISGLPGARLLPEKRAYSVPAGSVRPVDVFVRAMAPGRGGMRATIYFHAQSMDREKSRDSYESAFIGP